MGTSTASLHPVLHQRFERLRNDRRFRTRPGYTSTCRSHAEQVRLWNGYINDLPGFNLAARPGTSPHEIGTRGTQWCHAIDASAHPLDRALFRRIAPEYGLVTPVASEWWHTELIEADERRLVIPPRPSLPEVPPDMPLTESDKAWIANAIGTKVASAATRTIRNVTKAIAESSEMWAGYTEEQRTEMERRLNERLARIDDEVIAELRAIDVGEPTPDGG